MTEQIKFKNWQKIDLRVGKIIKVENIEGADKLYKLEVDLGELGKRVICAGLKEHYSKDNLKGKSIIMIVNLEPREMRGIKSEGMLLGAVSDDEKEVVLISPEKDVEVGMRVS